ncbi:MAG TPA: serine/threonine-protein kinase [Gemmatimonadales bacterium]
MADLLERLRVALAEQYAVDRTLGAGGMATVFLATDLAHGGRRVAIKVLRPELVGALGPDRFLREIRLTANLQHPHILPLFQSGSVDSLLYYVMPFVEGESLRERLEREKQLPVDEAVRITTEIAHALGYAHDRGVIHRDVKPGNILLSGGQAILADFGIARALAQAGSEAITSTGLAVGTPTYMSPEQAGAGDAVDGRSDIYSLGCVLYEMLAGDPPFTGSTAQAIVARKWAEAARPLKTVRDTVPHTLDQAVLKAIARVPADRYPTAEAFAEALANSAHGPLAVPHRRRTRILAGAGLSLALAAPLALTLLESPDRAEAPDSRRVIVTQFENKTGDSSLNYVGDIAADWVIRELQGTELVQVVDQRALAAGRPDAEGALARETRAGTLISLDYYRVGDSLRFQARVTEAESGARLYTSPATNAAPGSPMDGLARVGHDLVDGVVALVAPGVEWRADDRRPPSFPAYREFMAGMALLPRLDFGGAIRHWFRAAELDTTFVTPLLSAASFMLVAGLNAQADSLVTSIEQRRTRLRSSERQRLDNLRARLNGNIPDALTALRPLAEAAPLSEVAWELALHHLWLNHPGEAITAFARLDPNWDFLRGWWFYWVFYCNAHHVRGEFEEELALSRQGRAQYPNSIRTTEPEIAALAALGQVDQVEQVMQEASAMPPVEKGDLPRAMVIAAMELRAHDRPEAAATMLRRAGELMPDWSAVDRTEALAWVPAMVPYLEGRWDEARKRFGELAARDSTDINAQGHLGVIAARTGDRPEALRIAAWLERLDGRYLYGYDTLWRARIAALLGEPEHALRLLRLAFGEGLKFVGTFSSDPPARTFGPWLHRDVDLESLRPLPGFGQLVRGRQ